jgi:hypothetical protein
MPLGTSLFARQPGRLAVDETRGIATHDHSWRAFSGRDLSGYRFYANVIKLDIVIGRIACSCSKKATVPLMAARKPDAIGPERELPAGDRPSNQAFISPRMYRTNAIRPSTFSFS